MNETMDNRLIKVMLKTIILAVIVFMTPCSLFAKPSMIGGFGIHPGSPLRFAQPFQIIASVTLGFPSDGASIDITLPEGVQKLSGVLHWEGSTTQFRKHQFQAMVQINTPGIYEVSGVFNVANASSRFRPGLFPKTSSFFLYVREDTIAYFGNRATMEMYIRDSLIVPEEELWIRQQRKLMNGADRYKPVILQQSNMAKIGYDYTLLSTDPVNKNNVEQHFFPDKVRLIKHFSLLFSPPHLDQLDTLFDRDRLSTTAPNVKLLLINGMKKKLSDLYVFDQKILQTSDSATCYRMAYERSSILHDELNTRKTTIDSAKSAANRDDTGNR